METNPVTELIRILNWAQLNHCEGTAEAARALLMQAMAPVVTAHPFALAS